MFLLEEIHLLLEASALQTEILQTIKSVSHIPVTTRSNGSVTEFVLDGGIKGSQGADDLEIYNIIKKLEDKLGSKYEIEELHSDHSETDKPNGIVVFGHHSSKGRYLLLKARLVKKSHVRSTMEGNPKLEYKALKLAHIELPGVKNELLFVHHVERSINLSNGKLDKIVFDGQDGNKFEISDVIEVRHVGGKNRKPDIELITEDGEVIKVSLKKRDFLEIDAGSKFLESHEKEILATLEAALDDGLIDIDETEKLSKNKSFELAIKLDKQDAKLAYFGEGSNTVDAVIIETFMSHDFKLGNKTLIISCDNVIQKISDVHARMYPYISINSDFERSQEGNPVFGNIYMTVVPRYRLQTHPRKDSGHPKSLVFDRFLNA